MDLWEIRQQQLEVLFTSFACLHQNKRIEEIFIRHYTQEAVGNECLNRAFDMYF